MLWRIKESATNRKLNAVVKGRRGVLDRIQVQAHEWFHSPVSDELFHYDNGVFEAYPILLNDEFHSHHTLKVLLADALLATVTIDDTGHQRLLSTSPLPADLWRDVTSQQEIESLLLARNQRHLEQAQREGGRSTLTPILNLRADHGFNPMAEKVLMGTYIDYDVPPDIATFFSTITRTPKE